MAIAAVTSCHADPPKGFEEFRRGLLDNFNSFKSRILEHGMSMRALRQTCVIPSLSRRVCRVRLR